ncbi:ABC transporter substrate-binding protein [Actibacterium ureilyticum]|uniref:ABC transporter substrate-binding protein n=1 Tax=Actibacterium ureilyticum TaxID=1590614 RepID=UPI000BAB0D6F|nr:CmpA/NrtA family ABC transporter substrate-binding protein [Actibacterium ureilyticum]
MSTRPLSVGFMPLVDAAPIIVAHELGFAEEEGLDLRLQRAPSWSLLRDRLVMGESDAAQMLSPVPVAMALGLGGVSVGLDALSVLSVNGNVIGVSTAVAQRLRDAGYVPDFQDADAAGRALSALSGPLRVGVPFPFSMHAELLDYWLSSYRDTTDGQVQIRTVPPPLMADAIAADEIDAFCVGEPWGSKTVENGDGELLLPGAAIWQFAPEKVLAARSDWVTANPDLTARLLRSVWKAALWLSRKDKQSTVAEILSWPEYLGVPVEMIERALSGRILFNPRGEIRKVPQMLEFHAGAATFPWRSQAAWIAYRLARRYGIDPQEAIAKAAPVFRSDIYREVLGPMGADQPGASEKIEGSLQVPTPVASDRGGLILGPDAFFDGAIFDPSEIF